MHSSTRARARVCGQCVAALSVATYEWRAGSQRLVSKASLRLEQLPLDCPWGPVLILVEPPWEVDHDQADARDVTHVDPTFVPAAHCGWAGVVLSAVAAIHAASACGRQQPRTANTQQRQPLQSLLGGTLYVSPGQTCRQARGGGRHGSTWVRTAIMIWYKMVRTTRGCQTESHRPPCRPPSQSPGPAASGHPSAPPQPLTHPSVQRLC
jgi:hypothetical protein